MCFQVLDGNLPQLDADDLNQAGMPRDVQLRANLANFFETPANHFDLSSYFTFIAVRGRTGS